MNEPEQNEAPIAAPGPAEPVAPRPSEGRASSLLELLTNPRVFFEAFEERPVSLGVPFLIVVAVGVVGAIAAYLSSSVLLNAIAIPEAQGFGSIFGVIGGIGTLIVIVLIWVITTAVLFAISMAFNGEGDFNRLLAYSGYGYLPQAIGGVITLILTWSYYSNLRIPPLTSQEAILEWGTTISSNPALQVVNVIGLIFLLWSANTWIFGVRAGRKLSSRNAAVTVCAPVLVYILIVYLVLPLVM